MIDNASGVLLAALDGSVLTADESRFFSKESPAGITLFKRNVPDDIRVLHELTSQLQSLRNPSDPPFIIAVDQEGGRVSRLKGHVTDHGPAMDLAGGEITAQALASISSYAKTLGSELKAMGINTNFAPCADILTEPSNSAIGDRAFGTDLESVQKRAAAFLAGLNASKVFGSLKHFPGQGDAAADTHLQGISIDYSQDELTERELAAFVPMLKAAPMVMISHCVYPAWSLKPASVSAEIITDLLKVKLQYTGVVVSDDMLMGAIPQDEKEWQDKIIESVAAGTDLILVCKHLDRARLALEALRAKASQSKAFSQRLADAAKKVLTLRRKIPSS